MQLIRGDLVGWKNMSQILYSHMPFGLPNLNESLNYLKARKQHEILSAEHVSYERSPDEKVNDAEADQQLQSALMQLNPDHRIVLVLCHFHNLTYKEISAILDVPEKTVKSRLFSARKNLKELLEREGI